jgi:phosphate:Na+ symporter
VLGQPGINWVTLAIGALGGLALFLFGLELLSGALKAVAGRRLKRVIAKATATRWRGLLTGIGVTAVMQSSSMTITLLIGFVSAGLMTLRQSISVLMGAEIGTTVTAQLIAFRIGGAALLLVAAGWAGTVLLRRPRLRLWARAVLGLGLLFFGMNLLRDAVAPLQHFDPLTRLLTHDGNILLALLGGMLFTALIQSSTACIGIVIALASQGIVDLSTGIAISLGANVGTCITGVLASSNQPGAGRQVAAAQVIFNVLGVLLFASLIHPYSALIEAISPRAVELSGAARLAAEVPRQLANAHTIFNVSMGLACVWLAGPLAQLVEALVRPRLVEETLLIQPRYLSPALLREPSSALEMARMELERLGRRVLSLVAAIPQLTQVDEAALTEQRRLADEVTVLYEQVLQYLGRVSLNPLSDGQREEFLGLLKAGSALQHIASIARRHFIPLAERHPEGQLKEPAQLFSNIESLHGRVLASLQLAVAALAADDEAQAQQVLDMEAGINAQIELAQLGEAQVHGGDDDGMQLYARKLVLIENLKRIEYYARRVAKTVILHADTATD